MGHKITIWDSRNPTMAINQNEPFNGLENTLNRLEQEGHEIIDVKIEDSDVSGLKEDKFITAIVLTKKKDD